MLWASPVRHTCCWRAVKNLRIIKTISLSGLCVTNTPVQVLIIKLSISSGVTGRVSSLWQLSDGVVRGIAVVWSSCQQKVSVRVWRHSPVSLLMRFRKSSIWTDSYTAQDQTTDLHQQRTCSASWATANPNFPTSIGLITEWTKRRRWSKNNNITNSYDQLYKISVQFSV